MQNVYSDFRCTCQGLKGPPVSPVSSGSNISTFFVPNTTYPHSKILCFIASNKTYCIIVYSLKQCYICFDHWYNFCADIFLQSDVNFHGDVKNASIAFSVHFKMTACDQSLVRYCISFVKLLKRTSLKREMNMLLKKI